MTSRAEYAARRADIIRRIKSGERQVDIARSLGIASEAVKQVAHRTRTRSVPKFKDDSNQDRIRQCSDNFAAAIHRRRA